MQPVAVAILIEYKEQKVTNMSKVKWNKGRNCVISQDFGGLLAGDKAWIFDVTDTGVVVLSKTTKDVDASRALKKVVMTFDQADDHVKLTIGKPRTNFKDVLVTQEQVDQLVADKLSQL